MSPGSGPTDPDDRRADLAADLAARSDDALAELFTLRPDLAAPPPQGSRVLAQRALTATSIALAGDGLDLLGVAVLEQIIALARTPEPVTADAVVAALAGRADRADLRARIAALRARAVLWGDDDALHVPANAASALPWRARHLTGPLGTVSPAELVERLDGLDEHSRELLTTLSRGPALGRTRDAAPTADPTTPIARLIDAGLLARIDAQTVELPPQLGRLLRGEPPLRSDDLRRPLPRQSPAPRRLTAADVDAAAGGEALELIRHTTSLLRVLGRTPAAVLRSGALGVREQRRLAKATGLPPTRIALLVELTGQARLIDAGFAEPPPAGDTGDQVFAPTAAADTWLHQPRERQWYVLAQAWLSVPRRPWQVAEPDRDGSAIPALSAEIYDATAPAQRLTVLHALDRLAADAAPTDAPITDDDVVAAVAWAHPHQLRRLSPRTVSATLTEARELGLIAHHRLSGVGRAVLDTGTDTAESTIIAAMHTALPAPVDHFLTQADLTLTVPGPMTSGLAEFVELVADLESGGAASVYRVSEASVRRALDAGRSGSELVSLFTAHSRTPVPQSVTYLIEDVARRHGRLRVGIAASFVRCDDAATLAEVLRSSAAEELALRALAPTVAVSPTGIREVLDTLRAAGFAPAGEDTSGELVDLRERGSRVPGSRARMHPAAAGRRPALGPDQVRQVVSRLRAHDRAIAAHPVPDSSAPVRASGNGQTTMALIQLALRTGRALRVAYVDAQGSASRHVVSPSGVGGGQLIGVDNADDEQRFSLHRITSVELLAEDAR
ncbi:MAG: helicase-associated domain-containing protein [Gordonia sp. (in: high G+C Gram-positive bacteria)]